MLQITTTASTTVPGTVKTYNPIAPQVQGSPARWGDNSAGVLPKYRPRATSMFTSGSTNGKTTVRYVLPLFYTNTTTGQVLPDGNVTVDIIISGPLVVDPAKLESALGQAVAIAMSTEVKSAWTDRRPNV